MSQKKLQQDIDKLLKKVKEGLEEFDVIHDKFEATDPMENASYKEKLEGDLKREIKKLQKLREQIKTWIAKEDVKDKAAVLLEHRRLIETDMERFKVVEKLMKTKQFSKEALNNPDIVLDPRDAHKNEQMQFVMDMISELQTQAEIYEGKGDSDSDEQVKRHEFHIENLEHILRLLQHDEIAPAKIDEFKDDITYYVENNDDPDFVEYDTLYEDMGCALGQVPSNPPSSIDNSVLSSVTTTAPSTANSASASVSTSKVASAPVSARSNNDSSPKKKKIVVSASAANTNPSTPQKQAAKTISSTTTQQQQNQKPQNDDTNDKNDNTKERELEFPKDRSEEIERQLKEDVENNEAFKNPLFKDELKYWLKSKRTLLQPYKEMPQTMLAQLESSLLNCPDSLDADSPYLYRKPLSQPHPTSIFFPNEPIRFVYPYEQAPKSSGNGTSELSANPTGGSTDAKTDGKQGNADASSNDIYSNTSLAKILTKFDLDTLFFIFYHYQGTYEQFLSARELHRNRNWIFNKVNRCWYYKEIEKLPPGMNRSEEESWRYFDYKKSWLSRRCGPDFIYKEEEFEKL